MIGVLIAVSVALILVVGFILFAYTQYRKILREAKNYERGLKMVPLLISLPPSSDDIEVGNRDARDVTEEVLSQAQILYNVIASTATKGFRSKLYGQRHIAFEIVATKGLIHYYVVVPVVLLDVVKQAVVAAYPTAMLEEHEEHNIFSPVGKISGTIGGELTLKKDFSYPIATYQESKRDAMQSIINAISNSSKEDGAALQILLRPARDSWTKNALAKASSLRKDKGKKSAGGLGFMRELAEAFWKPPASKEAKADDKQLSTLEQATVDAIEDKTRHPGYEVLIRVIASSNTSVRSQAILKNIVTTFSLFDSPSKNGFKFSPTKNVEEFATSFIFRFFPQEINQNILNSVELATIFHLPDQRSVQTSDVKRQAYKQVDGPSQLSGTGLLLGYNNFRGVKKEIRLADSDRRRHVYIIGQTGTGKSNLLENLALQDMLDGKGFAFVDPHGDSVERLLGMVPKERVEDVIYFNPGDMEHPIGLNLFEFDTKEQKDFLIQEAIQMLYRLYDPGHTGIIGPRYEHWFRNGALTIMSDPNGASFIDIPQVFNDNDFAKAKLKYVQDQTVLDFWNKEMAQTSDYHKSEVLGWFVSKFGAFLSNEMMRNILGQTKSGFNLRDIMDNRKILLVNLSKGKTGELNSQLLGMIFVMKFQAAAMGRADVPESERPDFSLYVDEFQNFATESFETILSEARKYRLNLILANQFMTQLTDKIREAIIGNVGTVVSGRIGTTDAELMSKKFAPTFDAEDLTKLPNFESIASVMINNVPSAPFSMGFIPPLGNPSPQLADALKRLSSAKYGSQRAVVEQQIFKRLRAGDAEREARKNVFPSSLASSHASPARASGAGSAGAPSAAGSSSFLDEWLAKRKQQFGVSPNAGAQKSTAPITQPIESSVRAPNNSTFGTPDLAANSSLAPSAPQKHQPQAVKATPPMPPKPLQQTNEVVLPPSTTQAQKPITKADSVRLEDLQRQGLGGHISLAQPMPNPAVGRAPVSSNDTEQLERTLAATKATSDMNEDRIAPASHSLDDHSVDALGADGDQTTPESLDEIYIDVRGKLHHNEQADTKKVDPAGQSQFTKEA